MGEGNANLGIVEAGVIDENGMECMWHRPGRMAQVPVDGRAAPGYLQLGSRLLKPGRPPETKY